MSVAGVVAGTRMATAVRKELSLSPFHIAAMAFQRVKQLKNGARPRVDSADHRPTRIALLEVLADTISWTVV
jgi:DNA-directed RNA polymerase subunit K/omega